LRKFVMDELGIGLEIPSSTGSNGGATK
jgi:hypothetical protein